MARYSKGSVNNNWDRNQDGPIGEPKLARVKATMPDLVECRNVQDAVIAKLAANGHTGDDELVTSKSPHGSIRIGDLRTTLFPRCVPNFKRYLDNPNH